jgi:hypothetical protein
MKYIVQSSENIQKGKDYTEALNAIEIAASYSQDILKNEWERVKKGEGPFQIAKYGTLLIIIISLISLFYYARY